MAQSVDAIVKTITTAIDAITKLCEVANRGKRAGSIPSATLGGC